MEARTKVLAFTTLAVVLFGGCNDGDSTESPGSGGAGGSGGVSSGGGSSAKGGNTGSGGSAATGGNSASGGRSATGGTTGRGGSSASGGATASGGSAMGGATGSGGATSTGGAKATGGSGAGGVTSAGGSGPGGRGGSSSGGSIGTGGTTGTGGSGLPDGGRDGSAPDGSAPEAGGDTGPMAFAPCPATGACKILPLGDSITWGIGYDGSYRVKLFANTITDGKSITYVGKVSNGPSAVSGVSFPRANEGHSGWTIQQIDDIVTGKSSDASYKGKKLIVELAPHIVLLHIGTNDMYQSPSGADTRLGALIDKILTDAPDALLVVSNIIPFPQGASAVSTYNKAVPGVVQQRAAAGKHILFVDQFANFPTSELGDGVHPNQQGYDRMAGVWYTAIKSYLH